MTQSTASALEKFHSGNGAQFGELNGERVVANFGDDSAEAAALRDAAGILDLSFRGRLCLTGNDRARFLHGQVTNDVKKLRTGDGCYAALVTAKGRMQSDLNIFALQDELLLDFEPGLASSVTDRLEQFIVADDVQVVDAAPHYGLISVQGSKSAQLISSTGIFPAAPATAYASTHLSHETFGDLYLMNHARLDGSGFDLFVPTPAMEMMWQQLLAAAKIIGGRACGWNVFEQARIEAGIPRHGADMDESHIPIECGIESRAISFNKGCYIGQEVLNRIHTIGRVNRMLRRLKFDSSSKTPPARGDRLFHSGKEVGILTSVSRNGFALGYVHRDADESAELEVRLATGESLPATVLQ